jgi:hypothetical protein
MLFNLIISSLNRLNPELKLIHTNISPTNRFY